MKNTIIKYLQITLVFAFMLFSACTDNLIEKPVSIISGANYYNSDAEFDAAINGALHAHFSDWAGYDFNGPHLLCMGGEDYTSRPTDPVLMAYDECNVRSTAPAVTDIWNHFYISINLCNAIVSKAPDAVDVSEENKKIYEAQARFIRAFDYFYLTRWFGEIIIITTENQEDAENLVQSPVEDIYTLIIEDLKIAEQYLPLEFSGKALPTKGAAKALLAEVYLNMAGWPLKDLPKYALARDKAKEVIDMNHYSLMPNFGDLWLADNKFSNPEFLFFFNGNNTDWAFGSHQHQSQRPGEEGGWNDIMAEPRFYNAFPDGPRKDYSFWTVFADDAQTHWENSRIGKPYIAKYRDAGVGASRDQGIVNSWNGDGFVPTNRYAEVLLTYAEAANMADGGPSTAATDAINEVRRRAGGYDQDVYADLPYGMSQAEFDKAVIAERGWELAFECKRWFDLVRKEMVVEVNKPLFPNITTDNMLLPKPITEVELIEGLDQNKGYD